MPGRAALGPRTAAPGLAHETEYRLLVPAAIKHRARTHPLQARPCQRKLLPRRPPPDGLVDPLAPPRAGDAGARLSRRGRARNRRRRIRLALRGFSRPTSAIYAAR